MIKTALVILVTVATLLVVGAMVAGPSVMKGFGSFSSEPSGTEVRMEPVRVARLVETVSAPGEIEPHTSVNLAAVVSARIVSLPFREGAEVKTDDVIARLDDRALSADLLAAKARRAGENFRLQSDQSRLKGLEKNLEFAERELERMQSLFATGDVAERELDQALERVQDLQASVQSAEISLSVVRSNLEAADADIGRAQEAVDNTVIKSPIDGVITLLNVEAGEIVTGSTTNPGTIMMTIADLSRMILIAQIAESDIADLEVGQSARIFINAYQDDEFRGTVRQIALQRSGNPDGTGFFRTEVEIDLQGRRIRSGLVANVEIEITTHEGLVVPYQAIGVEEVDELPEELREHPLVDPTKRKVSVVYRVVDGKVVVTPVKAGASDLTDRLVLEGLDEGDVIVTGPFKVLEEIKHDDRVRQKGQDKKATDEDVAGDDAPGEDAAPARP